MNTEHKIKINKNQIKFIKNFKNYGFNSEDDLVNYAIEFFHKNVTSQNELELSAELYTELYNNDAESKEWIDSALNDWK